MELDTGRFTDYKNKVIKNCANVIVGKDDITQLQNFIKLSAKEFTETPVTKPAPAVLTEPADDPG